MAAEQARAAQDKAEAAEGRAEAAEDRAEDAETGARAAESGAKEAEGDAEKAAEEARVAEQEAVAAAEEADVLLLDDEAQRLAARATAERPFGLPGRPMDASSPLRAGFLFTVGGLLAYGLARAVSTVEHELLLVLLAAFVAIGLDPVAGFLVRRGMRRGWAVALIALVVLGAVGGFVAAAAPPLGREATQLVDQAPHYVHELKDKHSTLGKLNLRFHLVDRAQQQVSSGSGGAAGGLLQVGSTVLSATFETVIVLVLVIYFLADFAAIKAALYRLLPRHRRPRAGLLGDEVVARVGGYVLGNVFTSLVAIVGNYVVLLLLGVPYALVLSVLVGILDLVPLVGSTVGGAIVALVALATVSGTAAIITIVYHIVYRLFEDYLLNPRVLRRTVDVKPVVTVLAVLIGGALLGIIGALIAVPTAAAIQLYVTEVVYPSRDEAGLDDAPAPAA